MEVSANLRDLYEGKAGMRKDELNAISGPNEFAEFYNRLKQIKEFHRKHPHEICVPMSVEFEELTKAKDNPITVFLLITDLVEFTDEEGYGRYLDLHDCYLKYIKLKGVEKLEYLEMLLEYLQEYTDRVKPLLDQNELYGKIWAEFEKKWETGPFPGWPKVMSSARTHAGAHLNLSAFSSWEELASLGLDRLMSALMALGLKCGGDSECNKETAFLEAQIYEYVEILGNVQRKQACTGEERDEEDEEQPSESEDEDNEIIYNPKNLPPGWNGKEEYEDSSGNVSFPQFVRNVIGLF
ncbi:splicing factor 3A subunit 3 [Labeo rohita]|nr:splicing factor 3A subunit 3 [Labeo rohita]